MLEFENVVIERGGKFLLDQPALALTERFTALIGPNGIGKTTLLQAMTGTQRFKGTIRFAGTELPTSHVGYAPQRIDWPGHLTQVEVCTLGGWLRGVPRHVLGPLVTWAIESTGIENPDARVRTLSGGQLRVLTLAQALVPVPELLLLDEPTAEADVWHRDRMTEILTELASRTTIIATTHTLEDLTRWQPAVVLFKDQQLQPIANTPDWAAGLGFDGLRERMGAL